jgi:hypothetical protein
MSQLHVLLEIPLVFVSREARDIALAWVRDHGIDMRFCEARQCHIFVRPFSWEHTPLYVAPHKWMDFLCEPVDRIGEPDLLGKNVTSTYTFWRIAFPEALLETEADALDEIFHWYWGCRTIYIIVGTQPDDATKVQQQRQRWELENAPPGGSFIWNKENREFELEHGEYIVGDALSRHLVVATKCPGLIDRLIMDDVREFKIQLSFAVRRQ